MLTAGAMSLPSTEWTTLVGRSGDGSPVTWACRSTSTGNTLSILRAVAVLAGSRIVVRMPQIGRRPALAHDAAGTGTDWSAIGDQLDEIAPPARGLRANPCEFALP
jgi:hypothetical protein